jgi:hypothetical protein
VLSHAALGAGTAAAAAAGVAGSTAAAAAAVTGGGAIGAITSANSVVPAIACLKGLHLVSRRLATCNLIAPSAMAFLTTHVFVHCLKGLHLVSW